MNERSRIVPPAVGARASSTRRLPAAFGARFFLALVSGLVWLGPAWWDLRFAYAMVAWDFVVLLAWWVDFRRLPPPGGLEVSRLWLGPVSQGVETLVVVEMQNHSAVPLRAVLFDDVPLALRSEPPRIQLRIRPFGTARQTYAVAPSQRGDVVAGEVFIRYQSLFQIAERWATADLQQQVRVYPNLQEPRRHALYLIRSRQIELEKRLKRQRGIGREFESLREYREGDEPRDICWTATARRAKLIAKVHQVERSQAVLIVLDAGRLMLARVGGEEQPMTKLDCAVTAALTLAQVALYSGDRVGLLAYGRKPQVSMPAARGTHHMRVLLDHCALVRGELAEADHARAADLLLGLQDQRSLVVWLTDLAETAATPEVIEAASRLLARHLILFVAMGNSQLHLLVGRRPDSAEGMYCYVAAQEVIHRRELLLRRLRERGALALEIWPGQLATGLVNHYLRVKEKGLL